MEYETQPWQQHLSSKVIVIIQARLTSKRFPGKILQKIGGKEIIRHVVDNVKQARKIHGVVIATPQKIPIETGVNEFLGEEENVLRRFWRCSLAYPADIYVRITADCPLIDPYWIDYCVDWLMRGGYDYVTNRPLVADGLDVEVFTKEALRKAYQNAVESYDLEHVTPWMRKNLKAGILEEGKERKDKLSVDTPSDLKRVRRIYGLQR